MRTVFIIEDDPVVLKIYQTHFEKAGFNVRTATTGQESFALLLHHSVPDAILLDLVLPKINGVDVLKTIRAQRKFETIPIFVFTNDSLTPLAKEAFEAGANQVFDKSKIVPEDIVDAVRESLSVSFQSLPPLNGEQPIRALKDRTPEVVAGLCKTLQALSKAESQETRADHLTQLEKKIDELAEQATAQEWGSVFQMSAALKALLKELSGDPAGISASNLRTLSHAIDFLGALSQQNSRPDPVMAGPIRVLVVDDDDISRLAILSALKRANLESESAESAQQALHALENDSFDLIFLDISMPEMTGFEVCKRLRQFPNHQKTPVVFVTTLSDFASRSQSKLMGGSDFIAKPFLFAELGVKALTYSLKHRLLIDSGHTELKPRADQQAAAPPAEIS
jgi:CheY-like chemotaxis protein